MCTAMHRLSDILDSLPIKGRLTTAIANPGGDVLNHHHLAVYIEDFVNMVVVKSCVTAYVAVLHFGLRILKLLQSSTDGS